MSEEGRKRGLSGAADSFSTSNLRICMNLVTRRGYVKKSQLFASFAGSQSLHTCMLITARVVQNRQRALSHSDTFSGNEVANLMCVWRRSKNIGISALSAATLVLLPTCAKKHSGPPPNVGPVQ